MQHTKSEQGDDLKDGCSFFCHKTSEHKVYTFDDVQHVIQSSCPVCYASVSTSKEEQSMHLHSVPQYNGPAIIMRESSSARGEAVTSGPRPLTWNLGKLNPEKGGVIGLSLRGEG